MAKPFKTLQAARAKAREISSFPEVIAARSGFYAAKFSLEHGSMLYGPSGSITRGEAIAAGQIGVNTLTTRIA